MRGSFFFLVIFLACTAPQGDKIVVPKLHAGFYNEALERINDKLKSDPENGRLVDQKLFYCEQLGWPTTCISALDAYGQTHGMTNQLVKQYIAYYEQHERFKLLLGVYDRWNDEYNLVDEYSTSYINSLTHSGEHDRAIIELRTYLMHNRSASDYAFASKQYLTLRDTTLASYNLGKLHKINPENDLMWEYGSLLIHLGHEEKGLEVIRDFTIRNRDDFKVQFEFAHLLRKSQKEKQARAVLKPFVSKDTVAYLLADSYERDRMTDSAAYVLEQLVAKDSSKRKAIWKLGRLYEDRGWLLTSIPYFEYLIDMDASDTLAARRIDLIQRKIAYLQRLKFEERKTPTLELQPKKIKN